MLSKLMDQALADHRIVLIVTSIVPVVQQRAEHSTGLPPVIRRIENTRIATADVNTFVVDNRILGDELPRNLGRNIFDRVCAVALAIERSYDDSRDSKYLASSDLE